MFITNRMHSITIEGTDEEISSLVNLINNGLEIKPFFPKIKMIKEIRNATNMDLVNAKCLAEELIRIINQENGI